MKSSHEHVYIALSRALNKANPGVTGRCQECGQEEHDTWQACIDNIISCLLEADSDFNREAFLTACEAPDAQALINEFVLEIPNGRTTV